MKSVPAQMLEAAVTCYRLRFAIWLLRTARRLSDRAEIIIRFYEDKL